MRCTTQLHREIPQPIPHSTMASSGSSAESERVEAEPEGDGSDLKRRHLWGGAMECAVSSTNPTVAVAMLGDDESLVFEE
jgi:hypothetical protein